MPKGYVEYFLGFGLVLLRVEPLVWALIWEAFVYPLYLLYNPRVYITSKEGNGAYSGTM